MPTMGKRTMNIHVTNLINCRREHQVQDVSEQKHVDSEPTDSIQTKQKHQQTLGRYKVTLKSMNNTRIN